LYRSLLNLSRAQEKKTRAERLRTLARETAARRDRSAAEPSPSVSGITPLGRLSSPGVEERGTRKAPRKKRSPLPAKSPSGSPPPRFIRKKGRGRARPRQEDVRAPVAQASAGRSPRAEAHGDETPPAAEKSAE
jgi:hypothetical protein